MRTKPSAGCVECSGLTPRWLGKRAGEYANLHQKETGHLTWIGEQDIPEKKSPPTSNVKQTKYAPEPFPRSRLSKRNMCDGKVRHRSASAAEKAIVCSGFDREHLNSYQCFYCGKWHVGHLIKPGRNPS